MFINRFCAVFFSLVLFLFYSPAYIEAAPYVQEENNSNWNLSDLYANDQAWQEDFVFVQNTYPLMAKYKNTLAKEPQNILPCLKLRETISQYTARLYQYAKLKADTDLSNNSYRAMLSSIQQLDAQTTAAMSFVDPEILTISPKKIDSLMKQNSELAIYKKMFNDLFRLKDHYLTPAEEALLSGFSDIASTAQNTYVVFSGSDMPFPKINDEKKNLITLNYANYQKLLDSDNRTLRQGAFINFNDTFSQYRNTYAELLSSSIKTNVFFAKTRHFSSSLEASLYPDDIPVEIYDNLITTVNNNLEPLHRYFQLRKKILKVPELHPYDLFCPLIKGKAIEISYDNAKTLVLNALEPLGSDYQNNIEKALRERWIDVYPKENKVPGAYSWGVYAVHPYILLNYNEQLNDVSTLAHELGHAMHSYYTNCTQPYVYCGYSIFCAETASTVNENLFYEYMLKQTTDKNTRLTLLSEYLENIRGTVYMQTLLAEYEKEIHAKAEKNIPLTADVLSETYRELLKKYYGNTIVVDKEADITWSRISHFYRNFYVYQYATGYSAAYALSEKLLSGSPEARENYIKFLRSGQSDNPTNLLKQAGVDMTKPAPIEAVLKRFSSLLDEIEQLTK